MCLVCPCPCTQLCHTCTVQCGNITKDGHVAATAALTPEVRAKLGGVEYLFAELAPRLEAPELQPFLVALAQHVVSWPVESAMRTRPWSHADDYSAHDTCAALETVTAALRVAQLQGEQADVQVLLAAIGKRQGMKRWQASKALQPCCVALRDEPFVQQAGSRISQHAAATLVGLWVLGC